MMYNNKKHYVRLITKIAGLLLVGNLTACATAQPNIDIPKNPPPVVKLQHQPKVALVLGCGGVRGYAHLGVLQALEEAHIPVDVLVGSSAGSMVGSLYADNNSFQETYNIMMPAGFWDYADISNISGSGGIINGYQLEHFLLDHMHARTFNQLQKKLIVSTSDVETGKVYPIESGPIAPAVVASSAIPGAVKPVSLYGHELIDGGVLNPVPVDLAKKLHPRLIIAVDLSETKERPMPKTAYEVLNSAIYLMGQQLTQASLKGADVVISPKVGDVGIFDVSKKRDIYLAGLAAARQQIPLIKQLLSKKHIH